jgi:site-specific recombinase XerC
MTALVTVPDISPEPIIRLVLDGLPSDSSRRACGLALRDRAILAVMLGCGLQRSEVAALRVEHIQ